MSLMFTRCSVYVMAAPHTGQQYSTSGLTLSYSDPMSANVASAWIGFYLFLGLLFGAMVLAAVLFCYYSCQREEERLEYLAREEAEAAARRASGPNVILDRSARNTGTIN